ncbi:MAG: hypothetical protein HYZ14_03025 [Bacteroidetes bacterium]|nr:hypothetical protein [Bacteroidota bacterium]
MITQRNYFEKVEKGEINRNDLPPALQKGFDFVSKATQDGTTWQKYDTSENINRIVNTYFKTLDEYFKSLEKPKAATTKKETEKKSEDKPRTAIPKERKTASQAKKEPAKSHRSNLVELTSLELKFIRRFVNLNDKKKDRNQIRLFINALQKSIRERKITKTSKYAPEIMRIQELLLKLHSKFRNDRHGIVVELNESLLNELRPLLGNEIEYPSVKFIKSYISLQGKVIETQKVKSLAARIKNAIPKKVDEKDKYWPEILKITKRLEAFIRENPRTGLLRIDQRELNGLNGILSDCGCEISGVLNGISRVPEKTIMNSLDVVEMDFPKLGFTGKWLELIGDPSPDFTAMISGKPKMGKSYFAVEWAGYLARNHGRVLYVAQEEGIDDTIKEKLQSVAHEKLDVSNYLPEDLSAYQFIFLDSVTKLGLRPSDLDELKAQYPDKAFIYIFQVTKQGIFRGGNGFQHDVDIIIEIPERGKAIQYGRFNAGGSMQIAFNEVV